MTVFRSYRSYEKFAEVVETQRRYIVPTEESDFLAAVAETAKKREEVLPSGSGLWRAQLGSELLRVTEDSGEEVVPLPPTRMKPLRDRAPEGRANPKGVPFFYAATKKETAIAEVRPWIGAHVSIAGFRTTRDLRTVNCTLDEVRSLVYFSEPDPPERERSVWGRLNSAFSRPVLHDEQTAAYVPTQILAELFRTKGFDGIGYASALGPGHNVVLFDIDSVDIIGCAVEEIKEIKFRSESIGNSYAVKHGAAKD